MIGGVLRAESAPMGGNATSSTIPAPVGGLNGQDPISAMPPTDALALENFFPTPKSVVVRNGSSSWSTGLPGWVETLMAYGNGAGRKLIGISYDVPNTQGKVYDCTTQGAVGSPAVTGLTNARFEYCNMGTPGGQFLIAANAADKPLLYDGTYWAVIDGGTGQTISSITNSTTTATLTTAAPHGLITGNQVTVAGALAAPYNGTFRITVTSTTTFTYTMASDPGGAASPVGTYTNVQAITGVTTTTLRAPTVWKNRIFFIEDDSFRIWYLPTQQITGAAQKIELGSLFKAGGSLQAIVTCTLQSDSQLDDYLGFLSTEGELALYRGTDPAQAGLFNIVGLFRIGRPIGRRCWFKYGPDTVFLTSNGYLLLSKLLTEGVDSNLPGAALSWKVRPIIQGETQLWGDTFGWQGVVHPAGTKLIINIQQQDRGNYANCRYQYVMNTITKAWCKFTGWEAECFEVMADQLFYGGEGYVALADVGTSDRGTAILTKMKPAFNYFGDDRQKLFTMIRPFYQANGLATIAMALNTDFSDAAPVNLPRFTGGSGGPWNTSRWNVTPWGLPYLVQKNWQSAPGMGFCATVYIQTLTKDFGLEFYSFDYVYEVGDLL